MVKSFLRPIFSPNPPSTPKNLLKDFSCGLFLASSTFSSMFAFVIPSSSAVIRVNIIHLKASANLLSAPSEAGDKGSLLNTFFKMMCSSGF